MIGLLITSRSMAFLLIFGIDLLGLFNPLRTFDSRMGFGFDMLSLLDFQVRYLAIFCLFTVIDGFKWFRMGNLHRNIWLIIEFLKAPFLIQHFFNYILMTFLMILSVISVILLSLLKLLLSTIIMIRYLFYANK